MIKKKRRSILMTKPHFPLGEKGQVAPDEGVKESESEGERCPKRATREVERTAV